MEWIYESFIILAIWRALESTNKWKNVNVLCIVVPNDERSVVLLDHFRTQQPKMEEYLSVTYRKLLFEIEKRKIKNRKAVNKKGYEQEPAVQPADRTKAVQVWSWGNKYVFTNTWTLTPSWQLYHKISENKEWFHARENPFWSKNTWSSHKTLPSAKEHLCLRPSSLDVDNTLNKPSSAIHLQYISEYICLVAI